MIHSVRQVAMNRFLPVEAFLAFAETHRGAWREREDGELITNTWYVDELVQGFKEKSLNE